MFKSPKSPRMWCDFMDSMFQSPLMLLKSGSMPSIGDDFDEEKAPTFETTKADSVGAGGDLPSLGRHWET